MKIDQLVGLQKVFKKAGKNPHDLNIEQCLAAERRHKVQEIGGVLLLGIGALVAAGAALACFFIGISLSSLSALCVGVCLAVIGLNVVRIEVGENVLRVARDWRDLVREIKAKDLNVSLLGEGDSVASVFEAKLKRLAGDILECEKLGKTRTRAKVRRTLNHVHALAQRLRLEVSSVEDFFNGTGYVNYDNSIIVVLRK